MSRYDLDPAALATHTDTSPRAKWATKRKPIASIREFALNGQNVMRVEPAQRPSGWKMNDITAGAAIFPGDVSLVPECTGDDGIPDWAIAEAVRGMNPNVPMHAYHIREKAKAIVKEYRP